MLQSIYSCKTQSEIEVLVNDQPNPTIFFKVFLEIGIKSMVNYLAFDSRSIKRLLAKTNDQYFKEDEPIFFKNED